MKQGKSTRKQSSRTHIGKLNIPVPSEKDVAHTYKGIRQALIGMQKTYDDAHIKH